MATTPYISVTQSQNFPPKKLPRLQYVAMLSEKEVL